jgi:hypothetical protein
MDSIEAINEISMQSGLLWSGFHHGCHKLHYSVIVVIRCRTRAAERAALSRLLDGAAKLGSRTTSTSPKDLHFMLNFPASD